MNFLKITPLLSIIMMVGFIFIVYGIAWRFRSKYKNDLWVQNVGKWFIAIGVIVFINCVLFSIDLKIN